MVSPVSGWSDPSDGCVLGAGDRQVGIDIERRDAETDIEALARRFLSEVERSYLGSLEDWRRTAAFYRVWARKEAYSRRAVSGCRFPSTRSTSRSDPGNLPGFSPIERPAPTRSLTGR